MSRDVVFADFEGDAAASSVFGFGDCGGHQLPPDALAATVFQDTDIVDVNHGFGGESGEVLEGGQETAVNAVGSGEQDEGFGVVSQTVNQSELFGFGLRVAAAHGIFYIGIDEGDDGLPVLRVGIVAGDYYCFNDWHGGYLF